MAMLFLGMTVVGTAASAQVSTVGCGSVITSNTTLTADVGPCDTGNGLIVRGSNFTLNLNGHRVYSNQPLPRNVGVDSSGIYIPADVVGIKLVNATGVTVTNGTVDHFNAGISIEGGSTNTVSNVTSQMNQGPCIGEDFSTFAIGEYGDGIVDFGSPNNRLLNNTLRNNGPFSGMALVANTTAITKAVPPYPSGNIISGNTVEDNNICFADIGIRVEGPGASNNTLSNNTVRRSFNEGITINPVNVIDFTPLFQSPPACQNRGFPSPTLPQCPIQNPLNPTNDNNILSGNTVDQNGYGGAETNAGPNAPNRASLQTATGINLLSFCGYGADSNATGNIVQGNTVTRNAGDGIGVGGCPLGQNPAAGTFPGYTNTRIAGNTSVNNNGRGCGTLPVTPGCGSRPATANFDLHDRTNEMVCPSTSASTQAICAGLGFPAPPAAPTAFIGTRVTQPGGKACDNNIWYGNRYGTAFPLCAALGGQHIASTPVTAAQAATPSSSLASEGGSDTAATAAPAYPLRNIKP
ncbi:MAG: right-handed parallel beta-helix repeat-containing protein [Actinomycetota bacterium]|nr:right-handed parallel beta-helix repeat-containing protein [Actinomycetota bacterium]